MSLRRACRLVKLTVFSLLPLLTLLAAVEVAVRVYFYQRHSPYVSGIAQLYATLRARPTEQRVGVTTVLTAEPVFQQDSVVGYRGVPGTHSVTFSREGRALSSTVMFGEDGYRTTSPNPAKYADRPGLWIFGASALYGYGLSNEDTLPWLLQDALPGWAVRNFAMPGFGNLQALLQLTSAAETRERLPAVAVFVYRADPPAPEHRRARLPRRRGGHRGAVLNPQPLLRSEIRQSPDRRSGFVRRRLRRSGHGIVERGWRPDARRQRS